MTERLCRCVLGALLLAVVSACGGDDPADKSSGEAVIAWQLVMLGGEPVDGSPPTLEFAGANSLVGSAGCNQFNGAYRRTAGSLYITELALTRMFCGDKAVMKRESRYVAALEGAVSISETGGQLIIRSEAEEAPLVFEPVVRAGSTP